MGDIRPPYQSATGDWIVFDGQTKHRFATEAEARLYYRRLQMDAAKEFQKTLEEAGRAAEQLLMMVNKALFIANANDLSTQIANTPAGQPVGQSDWTPDVASMYLELARAFQTWINSPLSTSGVTPIHAFYLRK